jgi:hypothetical protein
MRSQRRDYQITYRIDQNQNTERAITTIVWATTSDRGVGGMVAAHSGDAQHHDLAQVGFAVERMAMATSSERFPNPGL